MLKEGDIVIIHKPDVDDGNPFWVPEMDMYDGDVGEIRDTFPSFSGKHTYAHIKGCDWAFNVNWFEQFEEIDENIEAADIFQLL